MTLLANILELAYHGKDLNKKKTCLRKGISPQYLKQIYLSIVAYCCSSNSQLTRPKNGKIKNLPTDIDSITLVKNEHNASTTTRPATLAPTKTSPNIKQFHSIYSLENESYSTVTKYTVSWLSQLELCHTKRNKLKLAWNPSTSDAALPLRTGNIAAFCYVYICVYF